MGTMMGIRSAAIAVILFVAMEFCGATDTNGVFSPCEDTVVQRKDGFTFGVAFAGSGSFYMNNVELSPCDTRLALSSTASQVAVFRPQVDQISLLTINTTNGFSPVFLFFSFHLLRSALINR
ncbi:hypothetical protein SUGI_0246740 [Cryptomeria japonica]|nr:hypothetical protein SUGI_0246740 [Cryptomeria japonica]